MNKLEILNKVYKLLKLYESGLLGGEIMPEDENLGLNKSSSDNYIYFTLPMALNYQRNSYKLWEGANKSYSDNDTKDIFNLTQVIEMSDDALRAKLLKYKVALQPNKHIEIWKTISNTIIRDFDGDIKNLFINNNYDVEKIKNYILTHKKDFPYLGGSKILNYWLYVIEQYTNAKFKNREFITVAPDTHVIQSSVKLGLINNTEAQNANIRDELAERWKVLLFDTNLSPIDIHTPMWLWSRGGFKYDI